MGQSFTFLAPKTPAEMLGIRCCCGAKATGGKNKKAPFLAPSNIQGNGLDGEFEMIEGSPLGEIMTYFLPLIVYPS